MDATDEALPSEAIQVAKDWLRLAPEVRKRMADMLREMVRTSSADVEAVPDKRIEETYGSPRTKSRR